MRLRVPESLVNIAHLPKLKSSGFRPRLSVTCVARYAVCLWYRGDGPTMFARIGFMRALNRHHVRHFNPDRKDHHWGRRKLARDR